MHVLNLLASLRRHLLLVLVLTATGGALGVLAATAQSPSYEATARIAIGPDETIEDPNDQIQVGQVLNRTIVPANLSELLVSERVLSSALDITGFDRAEIDDDEIEASVAPESNVVYLSVVSASGERPLPLVDAIAVSGILLFEDIYSVYRAEVIHLDAGVAVKTPLHPMVGAVIGTFVALIAAVYLAMLIDSVWRTMAMVPAGRWRSTQLAGRPGLRRGMPPINAGERPPSATGPAERRSKRVRRRARLSADRVGARRASVAAERLSSMSSPSSPSSPSSMSSPSSESSPSPGRKPAVPKAAKPADPPATSLARTGPDQSDLAVFLATTAELDLSDDRGSGRGS